MTRPAPSGRLRCVPSGPVGEIGSLRSKVAGITAPDHRPTLVAVLEDSLGERRDSDHDVVERHRVAPRVANGDVEAAALVEIARTGDDLEAADGDEALGEPGRDPVDLDRQDVGVAHDAAAIE